MIVSNLVVFSLLGVFYRTIALVVLQIGQHKSVHEVLDGLKDLPYSEFGPVNMSNVSQKSKEHTSSKVLVSDLSTGGADDFRLVDMATVCEMNLARY